MFLFHGSYAEIQKPDVHFSRKRLDFGRGFYLAKDYLQAEKWAQRYKYRKLPSVVNVYRLDMETVEKQYRVKVFESYDLILCPTCPTAAFKLGSKVDDPLEMYLSDLYTTFVNLARIPSISVPAGKTSGDGMPLGMQFAGKMFQESLILLIPSVQIDYLKHLDQRQYVLLLLYHHISLFLFLFVYTSPTSNHSFYLDKS